MDHEGDGSGDGLLLDESQQRALQLFHARVNVALLGRAGCGKSVVMRRMIDAAIVRWGHAGVAVGALSASAALVVGGQTLHSIFGMDTRPLSRDAWVAQILKRPSVCERLNKLRVLFVDEVFTLPSSLFTRLAYIMRLIAPPHMQHLPFGGCQVVGKCHWVRYCTSYRFGHIARLFGSAVLLDDSCTASDAIVVLPLFSYGLVLARGYLACRCG